VIVGSRLSQQAKIGFQQRLGHAYTPLNLKPIEREIFNATNETTSSALDNSIPQFARSNDFRMLTPTQRDAKVLKDVTGVARKVESMMNNKRPNNL